MRIFYISLFWKFVIIIVLTVSVFGFLNISFVWDKVFYKMNNEISKRVVNVGNTLSNQAVQYILYNDISTLHSILENARKTDSIIVYAFITDANNNVLVHTFDKSFPKGLSELNSNIGRDSISSVSFSVSNFHSSNINDISIPILDGQIGFLRLGIDEDYVWLDFEDTFFNFILLFAGFTILGFVGAFMASHLISKPIKKIKIVTESIDIDNIENQNLKKLTEQITNTNNYPENFHIKDEIDDLTEKFCEMLIRLDTIYKELISTQNAMNQSEKLASIGTLVAGIAHEVNNPLSGMKSCIRRMSDKPDNIPQNIKYLNIMNEATEKMNSVIKGLLDFSRSSNSEKKLYNISHLIKNAINLVLYRQINFSILISGNFKASNMTLYCNKNEMEQVFFNLLKNSIDAIEEKFKTADNLKGEISINIERNERNVFIDFWDNGIGISEAELHKVIDPFYTTKDVGKGTGLGCSICYNIVREHKGEMKFNSEFGQWTSVKLIFENNMVENKNE